MRVVPIVAMTVFLCCSAALAQTPAPAAPPAAAPAATPTPPVGPEGITRDDYIKRAQDRAAKAAATRFDEMDADHDGILTKDEIAAYRAAHTRKKATPQ